MDTKPNRRLRLAWLALTSITLAYLAMDYTVDCGGSPRPNTVVTLAAIVTALLKVRIIFREFMEVRHAPTLLARLTDAWIALIGASLLGSYLIGTTTG